MAFPKIQFYTHCHKCFENSHIKGNPRNSYIFLSNAKTEKVTINDVLLTSSVQEKLLDITLDCELKLGKYKQVSVTKPVKKCMFSPELQATCH